MTSRKARSKVDPGNAALRGGRAEAGDPALEAGIGAGRAGRQQKGERQGAAAARCQHSLAELANEHLFLHGSITEEHSWPNAVRNWFTMGCRAERKSPTRALSAYAA